jgi:hypothetical protein
MRLSPARAAKLARLAVGESLPKSQISKSLLSPLLEAHAVRLEKSGSSYVVRGIPGKLARVVEQLWGIRDLGRLAAASPEKRNRAMLAEIAGDSKALPTSPFGGVFIRSFGKCYLRDQPLGMTPRGSALLIMLSELPQLRIDTKCIIGVEGVECLLTFEDAQKYFPQLNGLEYTLVLRWHWSAVWRRWLGEWKGQFFHFPDYDPAGLNVFATEVLPYRPDARLLIPSNFDHLLEQRGDRDLYLRHEKYLDSLAQHAELAAFCQILKKTRKALEQEALLS